MKLEVEAESWPLVKPFRITRETIVASEVIRVTLVDGPHRGRGEGAGVPYRGEDCGAMIGAIEAVRPTIERGIGRPALQGLLPPGGARNALDCALWDLEAKCRGTDIWSLLELSPRPLSTVYSVGIDRPAAMAAEALAHAAWPLLKVKAGIGDTIEQLSAIRAARPGVRLIVDANQGWTIEALTELAGPLAALGVEMIEQPLPAGADEGLLDFDCPLPLCADESCQTTDDLPALAGKYDMINIKLDKTGGLSAALELANAARAAGLGLMVGNMLGTSLAMAPGFVIGQMCRYVDLDGPLLQQDDRDHAIDYRGAEIAGFSPLLWG